MENKWFFVINPVAGSGKGMRVWKEVSAALKNADIDFHWAVSEYAGHATAIVLEARKNGFEKFIAIGGDGTLNQVINGIFSANSYSKCTFGLIAVGTGNDWVRTHKQNLNAPNIVAVLQNPSTTLVDVGGVQLDENTVWHYFINVAGIGIDGQVAEELHATSQKGKKGKLSYLHTLIRAIFKLQVVGGEVFEHNEKKYSGEVLTVTFAKGTHFGAGMHISPNAQANSGTFDVTIVKNASKLTIFSQLHKVFVGNVQEMTFVEQLETAHPKVVLETELPVQLDGEFIGRAKKLHVKVVPKSIHVIGYN